MRTRQIISWIVVLSVFLLAIVLCIAWEKFTSPAAESVDVQQVYDPKPALARVSPSVVTLWAIKKEGVDTHIGVIGCGLVVDPHGLILTSASIVGDIESLYVIDCNDNKYQVSIITTDERSKLTLLKAAPSDATESWRFEAAELADPKRVRKDDRVYVLGGRRTPSSWELTTKAGKVTRLHQSLLIEKARYRDLVQTNVVLASENVGGPVVNLEGEVVGFALPFVLPPHAPASLSYAVGADESRHFLESLPIPHWSTGIGGQVCSWLGAEMLPISPVVATDFSVSKPRGEVVNYIRNNSPAEHAGLKRGDIVMDIGGNKIADSSSFYDMSVQLCATDQVKMNVLRGGNLKTLTLDWKKPTYAVPGRGSLAEVLLIVLIFALIYYFVYQDIFDRVVLFVLGAVLVAVTGHYLGFYEQDQMASALLGKLDVLCFIVGMQLISGVLEEAGALEYLAGKITLASRGSAWRIMWLFCMVTYALSLFVNNLTTIMLVAPMVLMLSKHLDCDPKPFLVSLIIASNLGGASTMVGDFPNMIIATEAGLKFYQFISYMLPICLLELFVLLAYLRFAQPSLFRVAVPLYSPAADGYPSFEQADEDYPELSEPFGDGESEAMFEKIRRDTSQTIKSWHILMRGLLILAIVILGFLLSDVLKWSPAVIAMVGGILALTFGGCEPIGLMQKVSLRDILFFSGLFVLVGAAEASGALTYLSGLIVYLSFGNTLVLCLLLMWVGTFVTCFLNAGPTTALFLPVVLSFQSAAPHSLYWWSLSLGVCAGSSGTLVGATAGSVTANMLDRFAKNISRSAVGSARKALLGSGKTKAGASDSSDKDNPSLARLTFREYASIGSPIMLIFLLISSLYVIIIYRW